MDLNKILDALKKGVQFAEELSPLLSLVPGGALIQTGLKAVGAVTEVVDNVKTLIADGTIVATSDDEAQIDEITQRLARVNDGLMEYVDNS